jgi:2-haloacid dehalogenase
VFDVNETLSDMRGLASMLAEVDAPAELVDLWFAQTLRDGFALTAAGAYADFSSVALPLLAGLLEAVPGVRGRAMDAARRVVEGLGELDLHPDVGPAIRLLADSGWRIVTLTNGTASVTERLLRRAGIRELVEQCLSVADAGRWKPHPAAYRYAALRCQSRPHELTMVAVHPWDIDGAARAGLRTAWLSRGERAYPPHFREPDLQGRDLSELAATLVTGS